MVNLALLIFLTVLATQVVSWVGKSVVQELAFSAYSSIFLSGTASSQRRLRKVVLEDKAQLGKTSSQDEFAKWAKLRRKLDKGLADLEKINTALTTSKASFSRKFSTFIWLSTTGCQFVLVWWYRKQPVFWLPEGWVPYPVAWILSFSSAPLGSVSSGAWGAVCKSVLLTWKDVVLALVQPSAPATTSARPVPSNPSTFQPEKSEPALTIEHEKLD